MTSQITKHFPATLGIYVALVFLLWTIAVPKYAEAHVLPLGTLTTELSVHGNTIDLYTKTSGNLNIAGVSYEADRVWYIGHFTKEFVVVQDGVPCAFSLTSFDPSVTAAQGTFRGIFTCPAPIHALSDLTINADVFSGEFLTYSHFVTVFLNGTRYEMLFDRDHALYPLSVKAESTGSEISYFLTVAGDFIWRGMLHIFTGYDHILFLLSIILLSRKISKLLTIITAFTIAHSITLLLASFHIVEISSRIVEPAIALTIAYMAYRNIMELVYGDGVSDKSVERWALTFCFGLIHGLGFASALADSNIPQIFFVPSLLSFNVGIELGQICILSITLPLLFLIDKWRYRKRALLTISCVILSLALLWFTVRVTFGETCSTWIPLFAARILCI